ncbi:MAG: TonB-dependent receptor [Halioglobus sp.]|nr:TonB-dependent receptor [Halioglobus sp.]
MHCKKTLMASAIALAIPATANAVLEEVVVTATKRNESLQNVPIAITAISAEQIQRVGANDFIDLATSVPSLSLRSAGPGRTKLNIRGVSAATGFAPTVSFYLDEMPIQTLSSGSSTSFQQTIIDPKLYDLERIEVLRGPQGTLYGSSSMGGTVRLITSKPMVGEDAGSINFDFSNTEEGGYNWEANAMANVGTGDNGALRVVASYTDADGWMDRESIDTGRTFAEDVNTEETSTVRAAYRYEFENAYIQPSVLYQKTEMDGKPLYNGPSRDYEQERRFDFSEPFDDEFTLGNVTYGHDLGGMDLLVSASYLERDFDNSEDITDVYEALLAGDFGAPTTAAFANESNDVEDTTVEARLSSNDNENWHWLAGLYYKDAETDSGYRMQRGFPDAVGAAGLANTQDKRDYEEYAIFGELTYEFLEDFSVTLGGRYLDYEISQYKEDWGFAFGPDNRADANVVDRDGSDDEIHGKLTTTWQYTETGQVYATVSNGTRPGGFNRSVPVSDDEMANPVGFACQQALNGLGVSATAFDAFDGDEVTNYELGWKADLSDRVRFNGALYYLQWDDIQQVITLSGDCGIDLTANLGEAESQGAEIELLAQVTDNFTVSIAAGYTDAELQDDVPDAGVESGDQLPDVPEWTANLTLDYVIPVEAGEWFAVANWNYVDETLEFIGDANDDVSDFGVISGNKKPDYDILDLRIGFTSEDNWEWLFYVDNVTDEEAIYSYSDALAFNLDSYDRTVRNRPRTFGTSFTYNF